jgi:hypothetical protein
VRVKTVQERPLLGELRLAAYSGQHQARVTDTQQSRRGLTYNSWPSDRASRHRSIEDPPSMRLGEMEATLTEFRKVPIVFVQIPAESGRRSFEITGK